MPVQYALADHVHACRVGRHFVLLDIRSDAYHGVDGEEGELLGAWIAGWPHTSGTSATNEPPGALQDLLQSAMVVPLGTATKARQSYDEPRESLIDGYPEQWPAIRTLDVVRFVLSVLKASILIRALSLEAVVSRYVRSRGRIEAGRIEEEVAVPMDRLASCVLKFRRLRPLLFTSAEQCLFYSLALGAFLVRQGFRPRWVFGVTVNPFSAHCWLQLGPVVVNDSAENVQRYTRIMVA
jgi:hypothetical protein